MTMTARVSRGPHRQSLEAQAVVDPVHQRVGEVLRGEGAAQKARQGDGDLDGGEEAGGLLHHLEEAGGGLVPLLRQHAEPAGGQGDDGDLRHGEKGVDEDQDRPVKAVVGEYCLENILSFQKLKFTKRNYR